MQVAGGRAAAAVAAAGESRELAVAAAGVCPRMAPSAGAAVRSGAEMSDNAPPHAGGHKPVMLEESLRLLNVKPGETVVDGTLGLGGHAAALRRALEGRGLLIATDRDPLMCARARANLDNTPGAETRIFNSNFSELDSVLRSAGASKADAVLLDLGVASPQIDQAARGFSYRAEGPLDMRMTPEGPSAAEWLAQAGEEEIADVLYRYGEERLSRRIARAIVAARQRSPIRTTAQLAEIIRRAYPGGPRRLHPARRSFQGIRIFLNGELDHLDRFLSILPGILQAGGRCAVISYHSLEDRRVKNAFREGARAGAYELLTRKPLRPSPAETESNPRSRSARLRAVIRTAQEGNT